jgi:hypothetical protein
MEMALLKICAVMIVAVAMDMVLAHALELPGKLQLSKEQYLAVQAIYYPGFTFGGITEPLGVIVTALLVWLPAARRRRGFLCVQLRKAGSVRTNGLDLSERSLGILPPRARRFGCCGICPLGHCRGARLKI